MNDTEFVEGKARITALIEQFFKEETTSQERKQIIGEVEQCPEYLSGALFNTIGHYHKFEINGKLYTLEYMSKYYLEILTGEYEVNLYSGQEDDKKLLKQEVEKRKSTAFTKFMKLVDAIKDGTFDIGQYCCG